MTYYVDGVGGSDDADGRAAAKPWKTLSEFNATTFLPGDKILLAAGQSWTGQLHPLGSGAAANPNICYEGNGYWGDGNFPPGDAHAVNTDPGFVAPGQGSVGSGSRLAFKTLDGYKLQAGSHCIDAGSAVPGDAKTVF